MRGDATMQDRQFARCVRARAYRAPRATEPAVNREIYTKRGESVARRRRAYSENSNGFLMGGKLRLIDGRVVTVF